MKAVEDRTISVSHSQCAPGENCQPLRLATLPLRGSEAFLLANFQNPSRPSRVTGPGLPNLQRSLSGTWEEAGDQLGLSQRWAAQIPLQRRPHHPAPRSEGQSSVSSWQLLWGRLRLQISPEIMSFQAQPTSND